MNTGVVRPAVVSVATVLFALVTAACGSDAGAGGSADSTEEPTVVDQTPAELGPDESVPGYGG